MERLLWSLREGLSSATPKDRIRTNGGKLQRSRYLVNQEELSSHYYYKIIKEVSLHSQRMGESEMYCQEQEKKNEGEEKK